MYLRAVQAMKALRRMFSSSEEGKSSTFEMIPDRYHKISDVRDDLQSRGLESSDMAIFVDFTKSNTYTGKEVFEGRCLHSLGEEQNPYQQVISIIGATLEDLDDDNLIPTYGFGDAETRCDSLFCFMPHDEPVHTLQGVFERYNAIVPQLNLSGPTSLAPAIYKSVELVIRSGHKFHIAVIIADGQISEECLKGTVDAIVLASHYCLSIVMVGVGDGPWDQMRNFDDQLPKRHFDNFQFVDFATVMVKSSVRGYSSSKAEALFALSALQEVPDQYKKIKELKLMGLPSGNRRRNAPSPRTIRISDPPQWDGSYRYSTNILSAKNDSTGIV